MPELEGQIVLRNLFGEHCDLNNLPWVPFRQGIDIYRIYGDGRSGPAAALLRYQPGASAPLHRHTDYEHVIVLQRGQTDGSGEFPPGTLVVNPPGTSHDVYSPNGCVVLIIWNRPVEFL